MRKTNKAGIDLIKSFEGLYLKPYLDPVNIPTIGIGTIAYPDKRKVSMSDPAITEAQAIEYLEHELREKEQGVEKLVKVPLNDNEFAALVCFAYNVGLGALEKSTLLKLLNADDRKGAADQFLRWNKAGGKELKGLTRRREAERHLFLTVPADPRASNDNLLPDGPTEEDIGVKLKEIEEEAMKH